MNYLGQINSNKFPRNIPNISSTSSTSSTSSSVGGTIHSPSTVISHLPNLTGPHQVMDTTNTTTSSSSSASSSLSISALQNHLHSIYSQRPNPALNHVNPETSKLIYQKILESQKQLNQYYNYQTQQIQNRLTGSNSVNSLLSNHQPLLRYLTQLSSMSLAHQLNTNHPLTPKQRSQHSPHSVPLQLQQQCHPQTLPSNDDKSNSYFNLPQFQNFLASNSSNFEEFIKKAYSHQAWNEFIKSKTRNDQELKVSPPNITVPLKPEPIKSQVFIRNQSSRSCDLLINDHFTQCISNGNLSSHHQHTNKTNNITTNDNAINNPSNKRKHHLTESDLPLKKRFKNYQSNDNPIKVENYLNEAYNSNIKEETISQDTSKDIQKSDSMCNDKFQIETSQAEGNSSDNDSNDFSFYKEENLVIDIDPI